MMGKSFQRFWFFAHSHTLGHNLGVVGITAHDNKVASVGLDCTIRLWNVQEGTEIKCIDGGPADAWSIAFSPDGNKLATGANEGKVRVSTFILNIGNILEWVSLKIFLDFRRKRSRLFRTWSSKCTRKIRFITCFLVWQWASCCWWYGWAHKNIFKSKLSTFTYYRRPCYAY